MNSSLRTRVLTLIALVPMALLMIVSVVVAQTVDSDTTEVGLNVTGGDGEVKPTVVIVTPSPGVTVTPTSTPGEGVTSTPVTPGVTPTSTTSGDVAPTNQAVTGLPNTGATPVDHSATVWPVIFAACGGVALLLAGSRRAHGRSR